MLDWTCGFLARGKAMWNYKAIIWKLNCGIQEQDQGWRYRLGVTDASTILKLQQQIMLLEREYGQSRTENQAITEFQEMVKFNKWKQSKKDPVKQMRGKISKQKKKAIRGHRA